ncbi:MAG: Asp-tRNA(Asn)/Glu-tRNA(Gln) amidotransferase subunit GatA, partial [Acidobacteria bacterium]|nr:Asp-tRNA(Asn)/Glu-tRNA(Gln) amidotransferase subunit GatA [Acidobacteriota bacterium]
SAGYYEAYYVKALRVRAVIAREFARAFSGADIIAMPTAPTPAFRLGARLDDPLQMYLADVFTVGASLAGLPAISVPCGFADDEGARLPAGLQLIGKPWDDAGVLALAEAYEQAAGWFSEAPGARA